MEHRFPPRQSRLSTQTSSSFGYSFEYDDLQRNPGVGSAASSRHPQRSSVAFSTRNETTTSSPVEGREPENVFATPPGSPAPSIAEQGENVFATPTNSRPGSSNGSQEEMSASSTPTPSLYRHSMASSVPRSLSPIGVSDGMGAGYFPGSGGMMGAGYVPGNGGFYGHGRSVSLSRSIAPSIASTVNTHGGLNRSNTVNTHTTTNSSTLYSIPSHLSQISSPPSPLGSIAPVRPRFDYGGHQQVMSVPGSEITDLDDPENPFGDGFVVPVGDGFAPHADRGLASSSGSVSTAPPPYSRYADAPQKSEGFGVTVRPMPSNTDSGVSLGESDDRRRSRRAAGVVVGLPAGTAGARGGEPDDGDNTGGHHKEWRKKEWKGMRIWIVVAGIFFSLLVGLAVGLGVGLGIGLHKSSSDAASTSEYLQITTTTDLPPPADATGPPRSDLKDSYPKIPVGLQVLQPINLTSSSTSCSIVAQSTGAPPFFSPGSSSLWSCNIPQDDPLTWELHNWPDMNSTLLSDLQSMPDTLTSGGWEQGVWGAYVISSQEGNKAHDNPIVAVDQDNNRLYYPLAGKWMEGLQGMSFWNQPLAFFNNTAMVYSRLKARSPTDSSYRFGILYNKTVLLRESTLQQAADNKDAKIGGNGTELVTGEAAWLCTWDKTLLDVQIDLDQVSEAVKEKGLGDASYSQDDGAFSFSAIPTMTVTELILPSGADASGPPASAYNFGPGPGFEPPSQSFDPNAVLPPFRPPPDFPPPTPPPTLPPPPPPPPPTAEQVADKDHTRHDKELSDSSSSKASIAAKSPHTTEEFEFVPHTTSLAFDANGLEKRRLDGRDLEKRSHRFPQRVVIKEYRPTAARLRQVLGMDLTDADPDDRTEPGEISCTRVVMQSDGNLREQAPSGGGNAVVVLQEKNSSRRRRRKKRDSSDSDSEDEDDTDTGCQCKWST